jgi:plasmid stability protein
VAAVDAAIAVALGDAGERKVFVNGAGRCGECHEKMFDEWEPSAHARAMTSPVFKAAVAQANDPACVRCHAPLASQLPPGDVIASEGVTCDVCHTLRDPKPSPAGAGSATFRLAIDDMVKYGPRCDLKDHYFHRMGCSPEHERAEICGDCHWWQRNNIPVFTEYADWKAGPAAKAGEPCQGCHMPKERAAIATGSPVRAGVPHHGLFGVGGDLRERALELAVTVENLEGALEVRIQLKNTGAGHAVPAGLPEHRLIVRARAKDEAGKVGEELAVELGRKLVDASGAEVPFWRATRVADDSRIQAGETLATDHAFHPAAGGSIEIEVAYRSLPDAIAKQLGVPATPELVLIHAAVPFGAPSGGLYAKLPKTVTVKPPAAKPRAQKAVP